MSRDIRSFFKIDNSKKRKNEDLPASKSNKINKFDDDKEEHKKINKKRRIVDSDDEVETNHNNKASKKEQKLEKPATMEVSDIKNLFGGPVKRKDKPKVSPKKAELNSSIVCLDDEIASAAIEIENLESAAVISPGKENYKTNESKEGESKEVSPQKNDKMKREEKRKCKEVDKKSSSSADKSSNSNEKSNDIPGKSVKTPGKSKTSPEKTSRKEIVSSSGKSSGSHEKSTSSHEMSKNSHEKSKTSHEKSKSSHDKSINSPKKSRNAHEKSPSRSTISSLSQPFTTKTKTPESIKPTKSADIAKNSPPKPSQQQLPSQPKTYDYSFVDKYKPTSIKNIIGQQGPQSNANKLQNWLLHWHRNHGDPTKKKKANPFAKDSDGSSFKAALLSGSPGIGKTTTAHLACKELLFDVVEFNASDTRSKKLLKEEVAQLMSNKSLKGYLTGDDKTVSKRHVLIMDEVDGMAGNEDRGGIAELITLIKDSQIPIICMCNDRSHPKMRSLVNYCYDLRFYKPSVNQIRSAMMSICFKEGIKLEPGAMDAIISGTGNDVRQTLNHLALYSASKDTRLNTDKAKKNAQMSEKDVKIGPWDVIRKVFSADEHKTMTLNDKSDLFFYDYNIAPLFVQENYLRVKPNCKDSELLDRIAKTAESISLGDTVEKRIRTNMAWSLLPTQAMFSSVMPGEYMAGSFKSAPNFPSWLGKNSKAQKRKRMAQEIHDHTRTATSGSRSSVRLDYAQFIVQAIVRPLKEKGVEGVKDALDVIKEYRLLREDIESLLELTSWEGSKNPWEQIDSKTKAALTRTYNKEVQAYSYSAQAGVKKKKGSVESEMFGEEEDGGLESDENDEDDDLEKNSMIKVKKQAQPKAGTSKAAGGASKSTSAKPKGKGSKK